MTFVKNLAGLSIVLGGFCLAFLISLALAIFSLASLLSLDLGPVTLMSVLIAATGLYVTGWVLVLFVKNFSWHDLLKGESLVARTEAPVALEVRFDEEKVNRYLLDTRHSPRASNPAKLGRGVFILQKKRGLLMQDTTAITLVNSDGVRPKNVRDFGANIYFDTKDGTNHQVEIVSVTELSATFGEKTTKFEIVRETAAGEQDEKAVNTKEQLAQSWADSIKG